MRERPVGLAGARLPAVTLAIPPDAEAEVLVRLASETVLHLDFRFWALEDYAVYSQRREFRVALFMGIACALVFISYLLAWGMRDAFAFLFPLAFSFILMAIVILAGFWLQVDWLSPTFRIKTMMLVASAWGLALLLLHARHFYELPARRPWVSRSAAAVSFSMLMVGILMFFVPFSGGVLLVHMAVLATVIMVILIALTSLSRQLSAWIYSLAYLVVCVHSLLQVPYIRGWTNLPILADDHSLKVISLSTLLFILALMLRMREIRLEYYAAQSEALEQREARARDQQALVHDLHDGLGGMAANISMLAAIGQSSHAEMAKNEHLSAIESMAIHAGGEIRAMMNMLEQSNVLWTDWARELYDYAEQIVKPSGLLLEWSLSGDSAGRTVPAASAISLMRALKESIQNVVKHSGADRLSISVSFTPDAIDIRVRDNGRGFDPALLSPGKGLASIRRRIQALGGQVGFLPCSPGMEVAINLSIPLKYPAADHDNKGKPVL